MQTNMKLNESDVMNAHHFILLNTFFSSIEINTTHLKTTSNIPGAFEWEYILPFSKNDLSHHNIYTSSISDSEHHHYQFTDTWMVSDLDCPIQSPSTESIHLPVTNEAEMRLFLEYFMQAYAGTEPNDPYGAISPSYADAIYHAFYTNRTKLSFFVMKDNKNHIQGVSAIGIAKPYCFSYCIGITPPFRRKNLCQSILNHHKNFAKKSGCSFLILQAAHNSFVENIYLKNNFQPFLKMHYYRKTERVRL